jgi:Na+/glutamate symporter
MSNDVADQVTARQAKTLALICAAAGIVFGGFGGIALGLHLGLASTQEVRGIYEKSLAETNQAYLDAAENNLVLMVSPKATGK